jgi:hypothetical protein
MHSLRFGMPVSVLTLLPVFKVATPGLAVLCGLFGEPADLLACRWSISP